MECGSFSSYFYNSDGELYYFGQNNFNSDKLYNTFDKTVIMVDKNIKQISCGGQRKFNLFNF